MGALSFGDMLGAGAIGAGFGAIQSGINNAFQSKAREENYQYGEKAADNAQRRQMEFYEKYMTPQARMKMLEEAGLSKSIMSSGGVPAGSGGLAPQGGGSGGLGAMPMDMQGIAAMQDTMASARLKNAQADEIQGENERGKAEIDEILARAGYTKAAEAFTKVKTEWQSIDNQVKNATKDDEIKTIAENAKTAGENAIKAAWEAKTAQQNYEFDSDTYQMRLQQEWAKYENMCQDYLLKVAQTELTEKQAKQVVAMTKKIVSEIGAEAEKNRIYNLSVTQQKEFFDKQFDQRKELFDKELNFKNNKMWVDFTEGITKEIISGAVSISTKGFADFGKGIGGAMKKGAPYKDADGYNYGYTIE